MKYQDNMEKSAEYLRGALPLMSKQAAALNPISYAVWYEYVAGINPPLKERIAELTANGKVLDDATTAELYRKYVCELDEGVVQRINAGLQKVITDMTQSAAQTGSQADQFSNALEQWSAELTDAPADASTLHAGLPSLLRHTREMRESITVLSSSLEDSRRETELLRQEVVRARQDALADGLTGLANRRSFDRALADCLAAAKPAAGSPCLLMLDIDHFKQVNDKFGHLFGDKVIRAVAQILKNNAPPSDLAARYGGEEFVLLLPQTRLDNAQSLAQKIRQTVEQCRIKRADSNEQIAKITVSIGVAAHCQGETGEEFIARADRALYASKHHGRNCVTVA